jgi:hypothetical protein
VGGLGARGDGRTGLAGVKQGVAAGLAGGDGAPVAMGGGGWAWELRWGEVKPFPRSVGAEGGQRRGLHGGVAFGGGNGGRRAVFWAGERRSSLRRRGEWRGKVMALPRDANGERMGSAGGARVEGRSTAAMAGASSGASFPVREEG